MLSQIRGKPDKSSRNGNLVEFTYDTSSIVIDSDILPENLSPNPCKKTVFLPKPLDIPAQL